MTRHAAFFVVLCWIASATAADIAGLGAFTYDGSGNITAIGSQTYRYDAFGRLTKATLSTQNEQTYTYDRYGNLVSIGTKLNGVQLHSQQPAVNPCTNRIQLENIPGCANSSTYNVVGTYDAAGNVLSLEGNSFEYDALNTTTASTVAGVRRVHLLYGASGERVASVTMNGGVPLRWDWTLRDSSNRVLRRLSFQSNVWRWEEDYIYAGGKLIAAAVPTPEKILHFHTDHLGTPRLITGNGGARVSEHNYFPFGREVPSTTPQGTATPPFNEALKFTGHERDAGTLDYMHARYYAPYPGRFLSVDPVLDVKAALTEPQMWNRYSYVTNNPLKFTDPDGRYRTFYNEKPMHTMGNDAPPIITAAMTAEVGLLSLAAGGPLRNLAFEGSLLLMRNPGTVLAAMKLLDSMGGNVSSHVNPAGQTGGKLGYLLGNVASEKSIGKGGFFAGVMGFTAKTLDAAIRSHFADNFKSGTLKDGRLSVTGAMTGANGVVTTVKTVWQWNKDKRVWDMITAVPAK